MDMDRTTDDLRPILSAMTNRPWGLHDDDLDELFDASKVVAVAGVEREIDRKRCCCGEKVNGPRSTGLPARCHHGGEHPAVCAGGVAVEGKWIECCFRPLKSVLSTTTLVGIGGRMRTGRQLGHAQCADSNGDRKPGSVDLIEVDENGRVE